MSVADLDQDIPCPSCKSNDTYWWRAYSRRHRYVCRACDHRFFADYTPLSRVVTSEAEYEKDVWDIRNLGAIGQETSLLHSAFRVNFTYITQPWLRAAAKKFSKYGLATLAPRTVYGRMRDLNCLSSFLSERYPLIKPSEIDRKVMVDFISFLSEKGLSGRSRQAAIYNIRVFLEQCICNDWLDLPKIPLLFPEDLPPREKRNPRYIPEEVLEKLNQFAEEMPGPVLRMFLVIQECGMRISELCLLKYDCISQDAAGDWWLTYHQFKMRKDHTITISKELVGVIQEQQKYIRQELGKEYPYLFCGSKGGWLGKEERKLAPLRLIDGRFIPVHTRPRPTLMANVLNQLAEKHNICTAAGERWHFQAHQFRHSVGTSMVNRGVPIHVISRFLGHETLTMTQVYAHLHDPTLNAKSHELRHLNRANFGR
ncbi:tyrosine-type recombinase/integrase [Nodosilinea sp. AN01ver1]|uniref:tyrosine-type recombinase/integrase n=1 Tax=Nodosilinea sp. AN01ver1 TaxID=3423362 RepID=UPI003D31EA31